MSQPQNTVLNGPSGELTMAFKEAQQQPQEMKVPPTDTGSIQQNPYPTNGSVQRPQLQRIDSRAGLQPRPGFPNQQGAQFRPVQGRPPYPGAPQFAQRPPIQRPPGAQFQPPLGRPGLPTNLPPRPGTPYPRPPQHRPTGIYPQQSTPSPPRQLSNEEQRSQALDPSELNISKNEDVAHKSISAEDRPALNAMKSRSYSLNSNPENPTQSEGRRMSVSSIGSIDENKKFDDIPSRPESRASSQMSKIEENDIQEKAMPNIPNTLPLNSADNKQSNSPSPQPDSVIENKPKLIAAKTNLSEDKSAIVDKEKTDDKKGENTIISDGKLRSDSLKTKPPIKKEGDHDSGVDESTQGHDRSNGDHSSPRKSSSRTNSRLATPTKNRSFSRGSRSPNLKSPDSNPSTPGPSEKKKIPMNKVQVGSAPSPNLKVVKSKIGSFANTNYKPGGGHVKIEHKKIDVSSTTSRIGTKNEAYVPSGGEKKILSQKLQWNAKSKICSLDNTTYKPKGGDKKIETVKLDFKGKAKSKVGSKDNIKHVAGGGDIKSEQAAEQIEEIKPLHVDIENKKLNLKVESKVGSLDNVKHKPGGGDKKIFDDKEYLRQNTGLSNDNQSVCGSQNSLPSQPSDAREPVSDENLNREH